MLYLRRHVPCRLGSPREQLAFVVCRPSSARPLLAKQTTNKATDRRALRYHRWIAISRKNRVAGAAQLTALLETTRPLSSLVAGALLATVVIGAHGNLTRPSLAAQRCLRSAQRRGSQRRTPTGDRETVQEIGCVPGSGSADDRLSAFVDGGLGRRGVGLDECGLGRIVLRAVILTAEHSLHFQPRRNRSQLLRTIAWSFLEPPHPAAKRDCNRFRRFIRRREFRKPEHADISDEPCGRDAARENSTRMGSKSSRVLARWRPTSRRRDLPNAGARC